MNPGAGSDLAAAFGGETYTIMLVANKFQTGFDQPLLSAMYVDKKLSGCDRGADPVPAQPHPPHRERGTETQDLHHRLRQQTRGHPGRVRTVFHRRHFGNTTICNG